MPTDVKYGEVTTEYGDIPDDEPVFVLRAQDVLAHETLLHYHEQSGRAGCKADFRDDVLQALVNFERWQGVRKLPD